MKKTVPPQTDTKRLILDSAEYLFAEKGFRGTSMREITAMAGVNLAAVNYHFGSKKKLVEDVIRRRLLPLNSVRKKRLEDVRAAAVEKGKKPEISRVLLAFIEPTLFFKESNPDAEHFITFIGRSMSDPDDTVRDVFIRYMKPLFHLLHDVTCEALPDYPRDLLFWRLHFTLGALFHTMHIYGNIKSEAREMKTLDARTLLDLILSYVTAGMKA
ncbi:MAG: TetR/AcrR family transcriptional regulator [Nitrospirota bacterium]